ncbi:chymotrypsin BI-like [Zophobas morio]|uniref:chymotrypsin BI-like n=1 Tax=Zophobas morio TaxID=2755281 RepID=UPI003082C53A
MFCYNIKVLFFLLGTVSCIYSREISKFFITSRGATTRIIGGQNATVNQFPFAAAIQVRTEDSAFFCGGTLYGTEWIITAGQCVYGAILFTIRLGSVHLSDDDPNALLLATSEYFLHPDYNPETLENDIALIKLRSAITFTNYIRSIDSLGRPDIDSNSDLTAIGWGQTKLFFTILFLQIGTLAATLQYVKVVPITNEECKITYGNQIKDNMVCLVGNYNEGTCHGDTGSPLIELYSYRYTLHAGVASFISGNGCESTDPSGYTRTFPYDDWLRTIMY